MKNVPWKKTGKKLAKGRRTKWGRERTTEKKKKPTSSQKKGSSPRSSRTINLAWKKKGGPGRVTQKGRGGGKVRLDGGGPDREK